jgi:2-polyprenyl-3-methyl-5-hydroxy-6-metoxy-1,4-benzoquinol methylase
MSSRIDRVKNFFDQPFYLEGSRHMIAIRLMIVQDLLGAVDHARILDLGCGDGSLSIPLLREMNDVTMVDLSSRMLEIAASRIPAHARNRVHFINMPLHEFVPPAPYDVVLCIGVLAHVPSIEGTMEKIAQCLKPGAVALVEFRPNPDPLASLLSPYYAVRKLFFRNPQGYRTNEMSLKRLLHIAACNGLTLRRKRRHSFPVPGMAFWSHRCLYRYTLFTLNNRFLSKLGIEHIMLFTKDSGTSEYGL